MDPRKANEISERADEVVQLSNDCVDLFNKLTINPDSKVSDRTIFLTQYLIANPNLLIRDLMLALQNNGYPIDWIQINPDQILDASTFATLIICSEKQGNRNA